MRRKTAVLDTVLVAAGLVVLFVLPTVSSDPSWRPGAPLWHDGWVRYRVVEAVVHGLPLDQVPSVVPRWSGRWPLLSTLTATPLWFLGSLVESPAWWIARYNALLFSGGVLTTWLLLKERFDRDLVRTFLLLLVAASMFPAHVVAFFGFEVFTAVLVGVGAMAVATGRSKLGWPMIVLGVANSPATLVGLGLVAVVATWKTKRFHYLLAPAVAVVLILADSWVRSGALVPSYVGGDRGPRNVLPYSGLPGFSYPFAFGVLSIFFSFGKGLVFFAPGMFLPVRRVLSAVKDELWSMQVLWLAFVIGLVLVYATWRGWDGGFFWGPRFFLVASLPASLALAARLRHGDESVLARFVTVTALALSTWVGISGATYGMAGLTMCDSSTGNVDDYLCAYTLEFSGLWHPFVEAQPLAAREVAFVALAGVVFVRLAAPVVYGLSRDLSRAWSEWRRSEAADWG